MAIFRYRVWEWHYLSGVEVGAYSLDKFTALGLLQANVKYSPQLPKGGEVTFDFNSREDFRKLSKYDLVISSSGPPVE